MHLITPLTREKLVGTAMVQLKLTQTAPHQQVIQWRLANRDVTMIRHAIVWRSDRVMGSVGSAELAIHRNLGQMAITTLT